MRASWRKNLILLQANNKDTDQPAPQCAVWSVFILFASMRKSSLKYTWKTLEEDIFRTKKGSGGIRVILKAHCSIQRGAGDKNISILHLFSLVLQHMHLSIKSVCNKEHKGVIVNTTFSSNSSQSTRPTGQVSYRMNTFGRITRPFQISLVIMSGQGCAVAQW